MPLPDSALVLIELPMPSSARALLGEVEAAEACTQCGGGPVVQILLAAPQRLDLCAACSLKGETLGQKMMQALALVAAGRAKLGDDERTVLDLLAEFTIKGKKATLPYLSEALGWEIGRVASAVAELERLGLVGSPNRGKN